MRFQRGTWRAQSVGWALLALLLTAALLGAFSSGPLSSATNVSDGGSLAVDYQRLQRNGAGDSMLVHVLAAPQGEMLRIGFSHSFLQASAVESVSPPPPDTETNAEGAVFVYPMPSTFPARIHLSVRPQRTGLSEGTITLNGRESVRLRQFIYP